jgi:steroid 5-alpha reductase family enzyme
VNILQTALFLIFTLVLVPVGLFLGGNYPGVEAMELLRDLGWMVLIVIAYTFIVGELSGNNSQVDKLWSVVPILYVGYVAYMGDFNPRLNVMFLLVFLWGARLTGNFAMKGAYSWKFWDGEEDYRWLVLREKPEFQPRWKWTLFNLSFISGYQNLLILLFTLPAVVAYEYREVPLGIGDYVFAGLFFGFLLLETVADWQHWKFQTGKWSYINRKEALPAKYVKGFLDRGLWAYSRHPNYFAEQSIWVTFYGFSIVASGEWLNWSIMGCLLLIILFQGSARFSEEISSKKYPLYQQYQKHVNQFIPWVGKKGSN